MSRTLSLAPQRRLRQDSNPHHRRLAQRHGSAALSRPFTRQHRLPQGARGRSARRAGRIGTIETSEVFTGQQARLDCRWNTALTKSRICHAVQRASAAKPRVRRERSEGSLRQYKRCFATLTPCPSQTMAGRRASRSDTLLTPPAQLFDFCKCTL